MSCGMPIPPPVIWSCIIRVWSAAEKQPLLYITYFLDHDVAENIHFNVDIIMVILNQLYFTIKVYSYCFALYYRCLVLRWECTYCGDRIHWGNTKTPSWPCKSAHSIKLTSNVHNHTLMGGRDDRRTTMRRGWPVQFRAEASAWSAVLKEKVL